MVQVVRWVLAVTISANQLVNALTGGRPEETVSARAALARERDSKIGAGVCRVLNVLDRHHREKNEDHCAKAIRHLHERERAER